MTGAVTLRLDNRTNIKSAAHSVSARNEAARIAKTPAALNAIVLGLRAAKAAAAMKARGAEMSYSRLIQPGNSLSPDDLAMATPLGNGQPEQRDADHDLGHIHRHGCTARLLNGVAYDHDDASDDEQADNPATGKGDRFAPGGGDQENCGDDRRRVDGDASSSQEKLDDKRSGHLFPIASMHRTRNKLSRVQRSGTEG